MIETWNGDGDFARVVDTLEPLTRLPCEALDHRQEIDAWRFDEVVDDSPLAPGVLSQIVTIWQVGSVDGGQPPSPGERFCDSVRQLSTVRSVRRLQGSTRWRCEAVGYRIEPKAAEIFDVEQPVVTNGPGGVTVESWSLNETGVHGCFVPREEDPLDTTRPWEIVLLADKPIDVGARLNRRRGGMYAVSAVVPPNGFGEPWLLTTEDVTV